MQSTKNSNRVINWIEERLPIFSFTNDSLGRYPTPKNLNYWWSYGSIAGIVLMIMVFSGIFLAMNYQPNTSLAFGSVEHIMRDVNYGWLLRYIHMNGSSMFFIVVYIHMFRGLYFGSYKAPRELLWMLGVTIYLAMMATAFMGYVLPWGQMSFWGATVITQLFSAVPLIGNYIVTWIWGGYFITDPTINRFYAWHYLLPFILFALVFVHLWALHVHKSSNPLGIDIKAPQDLMPFHPYFTIKDLFSLSIFLIFFMYFVFFQPNFFGEADNYIPANAMITPPHIVPEWYFLPFYAILRAIPDKLGGVVAMFGAVLLLFVVPWLDTSKVRSARFRPIFKQVFWIFVADCILLGYVGSQPFSAKVFGVIPIGLVGHVATAFYFIFFLILMPLIGKFEKTKPLPNSIFEEVSKKFRTKEEKHA